MADYTLVANTAYSALSPTPTGDDRILLNGFVLTIDSTTVNCAEITAAGNAGTIAWSSTSATYTFSSNAVGGRTILQAGTALLWNEGSSVTRTIANCDIRGGSASGAYGINANYGTPTNCTLNGGSASGAHAINYNYGTPTNCTLNGGSASIVHAINFNYGTLTNCTLNGSSANIAHAINNNYITLTNCTLNGGSASNANAINNNYGTPTNCTLNGGSANTAHAINNNYGTPMNCTITGGSVSGAYAISINYGTPTNCTITGGSVSGAYAININYGLIQNLVSGIISDAAGRAIGSAGTRGSGRFGSIMIRGSLLRCTLPDHRTIWHIGAFHPSAVIQGTPTIVELWDTGLPKLSTGIRGQF